MLVVIKLFSIQYEVYPNRVFTNCQTLLLLELSSDDPRFDQSTTTLFSMTSPRYLTLSFKSVLVLVFSTGEIITGALNTPPSSSSLTFFWWVVQRLLADVNGFMMSCLVGEIGGTVDGASKVRE